MLLLHQVTHTALLCGGCKRDHLQYLEAQILRGTPHGIHPQGWSRYMGPGTTMHHHARLSSSTMHELNHPTTCTLQPAAAFPSRGRSTLLLAALIHLHSDSHISPESTQTFPLHPASSSPKHCWLGRASASEELRHRGHRSTAPDVAPAIQTHPHEPQPREKQQTERTTHKDELGPSPDRLELLQLRKSRRRSAAWQLCLHFLTVIIPLGD